MRCAKHLRWTVFFCVSPGIGATNDQTIRSLEGLEQFETPPSIGMECSFSLPPTGEGKKKHMTKRLEPTWSRFQSSKFFSSYHAVIQSKMLRIDPWEVEISSFHWKLASFRLGFPNHWRLNASISWFLKRQHLRGSRPLSWCPWCFRVKRRPDWMGKVAKLQWCHWFANQMDGDLNVDYPLGQSFCWRMHTLVYFCW